MRLLILALPLVVLACAGCGGSRTKAKTAAELQDYRELPAVRLTSFQPLRDEVDRIEAEKATPKQLSESADKPSHAVTVAALTKIYPPSRRLALQQAMRLMPEGRFEFDPITLERARDFFTSHKPAWMRFRKQLANSDADLNLTYEFGLLTDYEVLDTIRLAAHVEAFCVANSLEVEDYDEAVLAAKAIFHMAGWLNQQPHLLSRVAGAQLRMIGVRVAEAIARHPAVGRVRVERLFETVEAQLAYWPKEKKIWISERAHGLHLYELVRDGNLLSVLSDEQIKDLERKKATAATLKAVDKNVDHDQLFYLNSMRTLIDACEQPYYRRRETLQSLRQLIEETRGKPEYPFVADQLLLQDFEPAHRWLSEERALTEACSLALAAVLQIRPPAYDTNPLTGKPYELQVAAGTVRVSGLTINGEAYTIEAPIGH